MKTFYSHGKLLLSGEYLVLDGALALGAPTRLGQWLRVRDSIIPGVTWKSLNPDGSPWFETHFPEGTFDSVHVTGDFPSTTQERLRFFLGKCCEMNPGFSSTLRQTAVETSLEFPRKWGLGSSSTLVANLAAWAGIDPYTLLRETMGGSGYDIAAAGSESPFYYQLQEGLPKVANAPFNPPFAGELFFVYLNEKQDSREGISRYRNRHFDKARAVKQASELSRQMTGAREIGAFREAMDRHEDLIGGILGLDPVRKRRFSDYPGSIKSLGAWGGDFILVTGTPSDHDYFRNKGFKVIKPFKELILT
ncbi:MAG: GYDIA family GHMP kinase [Robiginitalea sp.]